MSPVGAEGFPAPEGACAFVVAACGGADGLPAPIARLRPAAVRQLEKRHSRDRQRAASWREKLLTLGPLPALPLGPPLEQQGYPAPRSPGPRGFGSPEVDKACTVYLQPPTYTPWEGPSNPAGDMVASASPAPAAGAPADAAQQPDCGDGSEENATLRLGVRESVEYCLGRSCALVQATWRGYAARMRPQLDAEAQLRKMKPISADKYREHWRKMCAEFGGECLQHDIEDMVREAVTIRLQERRQLQQLAERRRVDGSFR